MTTTTQHQAQVQAAAAPAIDSLIYEAERKGLSPREVAAYLVAAVAAITGETDGQDEYAKAVADRADAWVPACRGLETPTLAADGNRYLYCFNPARGEHAYFNTNTDMQVEGNPFDPPRRTDGHGGQVHHQTSKGA